VERRPFSWISPIEGAARGALSVIPAAKIVIKYFISQTLIAGTQIIVLVKTNEW
jgi:hypothetical protein